MKKSAENLQAQLITTPFVYNGVLSIITKLPDLIPLVSLFIIPLNIYKSAILWSQNLIIDLLRDTSHSKSATKAAVALLLSSDVLNLNKL